MKSIGMVLLLAAMVIGLGGCMSRSYARGLDARAAASVSAERVKRDVETLAACGTRHTLSDTASATRGIGAARAWIKGEMERIAAGSGGRLTVAFEAFDAPKGKRTPEGARVVNVVGVLRGTDEDGPGGRRVYIVGHYDSRNAGEMDASGEAPGANDDASGVACVLEAARVLSEMPPLRATVVFLCTAGEEQALLGAQFRASRAVSDGEKIVGVLNNDIVGDPAGGDVRTVRVFSEGIGRNMSAERAARVRAISAESDSPSRELARYVAETARELSLPTRARLVFRPDRFMRGGDHLPFNEAGFPAVRFTAAAEVYERQRADVTVRNGRAYGDVPEFVDGAYLANVARVNVATIVRLGMAPRAPENVRIITAKLGNSTTLRWASSHDALTDHYELVWRETTEAEWTHARSVGLVDEVMVDLSKDDLFFGVRAVGRDGYKSVVGFAGEAKE